MAPFIGIESRASDTLAITNSQQSRDPSNIHTGRTVFELLPTWYSLSLSPDLTASAALRFAAYAGLFFAVVAYPFANENEGERRLYTLVVWTALATGLLVASVGLVERAYWNGKILWVFVPWDWKVPLRGALPRASGPFVDPDHFANYLAMIFPRSEWNSA